MRLELGRRQEPLPQSAPFKAGVHYASAPLAEWPDAIRHWLARPEERRAIERLLPALDAAATLGASAMAG